MTTVTFQVLEGVDKGRMFHDLPIPVTIGREEGNVLRLNDERVSRFHAKVQRDNGDVILTDLDSTNGTKVNGNVVQIRRLRAGDRICVGRTLLRFGSEAEIMARMASLQKQSGQNTVGGTSDSMMPSQSQATVQAQTYEGDADDEDFKIDADAQVTVADEAVYIGQQACPPLPQKMSPAQAARFAEILDFLHRGISRATENIKSNEDGTQIVLSFADWQKVLAMQILLARYLRAAADPDSMAP